VSANGGPQQGSWGSAADNIDAATLQRWLHGERPVTPIQYPDVAAALSEWVLDGDWHDKMVLCDTLWECTRGRDALIARAAAL